MKSITLAALFLSFFPNILGASTDLLNNSFQEEINSSISVGTDLGPDISSPNTKADTAADQLLREKLWNEDTQGMIDALSNKDNRGGLTLLMIASAFGDIKTVKQVVETNTILGGNTVANIKGIYKGDDAQFISDTKYFVDQYNTSGTSIRAISSHGYTALTYAVIGGHYDVVKYLIERLKPSLGQEAATTYINRKDNNLWSPLVYAVAYKGTDEENANKDTDRLLIINYLTINGANTKVKGNNFYEGDLDLISIAAKYGHSQVIQLFKNIYETLKQKDVYNMIEAKFGTNKEIQENLSRAIKVAIKYNNTGVTDQLRAWETSLSYSEAFSHYRLSAGGLTSSLSNIVLYGVYNLKLSYSIDKNGVINDVVIIDSPLTKGVFNKGNFNMKYLVRYFMKSATKAEKDYFSYSAYEPSSYQEAYVIIKWSYDSSISERCTFCDLNKDDGTSVIHISTVNKVATSEVIKSGGHWLMDDDVSGLTKISAE
ncbi:MAG: ankyrin repeat domain-containing protein [bacterium]